MKTPIAAHDGGWRIVAAFERVVGGWRLEVGDRFLFFSLPPYTLGLPLKHREKK